MAYSQSSGDSSPTSDLDMTSISLRSIAADLSLDDFNDEDLTDITEESSLQQSYFNKRFKNRKIKMSHTQILEHMKKIPIDMIQLDLTESNSNGSNTIAEESDDRSETRISPNRPHTLNLFSEPVVAGKIKRSKRGSRRMQNVTKVTNSRSHDGFHHQELICPSKTEDYLHACSDKFQDNDIESRLSENQLDNCEDKLRDEEKHNFLTRSASEWSIGDPDSLECCYIDGEVKHQTHTGVFKFVPRHTDEMFIEMNDPIHVEVQADDMWYEGLNMRTGEKGIVPYYYLQSVADDLDDMSVYRMDDTAEKFFLYFIGSVEVPCQKGNDVLCQAMHKIAKTRRAMLHSCPPAYVCLMIGNHGVKMVDQSELRKHKVKEQTHYFQLKNISFCGHHPRNPKYFAFITRHPTQSRFACHTFLSEVSTRPVVDCFGRSFARCYQDYMDYVHPVEEIYLE